MTGPDATDLPDQRISLSKPAPAELTPDAPTAEEPTAEVLAAAEQDRLPAPVAADAPAQVSRTRRAMAAGANARDQALKQLVALLVPLIRATRYPTLAVVLLAGVPAVAVILLSMLRWGPDDPFWLLLGGVGLLLAGWFGLRRRQLLAVADDPAALTDALAGVITGREMWDQLVHNVSAGKVAAKVVRRSRPLRILGGLWRGVQMTGVLAQITDRPELQPLLPGRLRGIWFLGIACAISAVVLTLAVFVAGLLYLLGA